MMNPDHRLPPLADCTLETLPCSRRGFLIAAVAGSVTTVLNGCTAPVSTVGAMPGPEWPVGDSGPDKPWAPPERPAPAPAPREPRTVANAPIPRGQWARGHPVPGKMRPMLPVRYVTVHHSAGPVFTATDRSSTRSRLESIRRFHRDSRGWGDIGYHFAVDRSGRIWECRSLAWQGAHVADHNAGNIGVVALGDFDRQAPSSAQVAALDRFTAVLMRRYRVPVSRIKTHQEWAATACPGRQLQRHMVMARASGRLG